MSPGTRDAGESDRAPIKRRSNLPSLVRVAAISGVVVTVARFLAGGGNPNDADEEGRTLLHLAASRGHHSLCKMLLDAGASVLMLDKKGNDVFTSAKASGSEETIELIKDQVNPGNICLLLSDKPDESTIVDTTATADTPTNFSSVLVRLDIEGPAPQIDFTNDRTIVSQSDWEVEEVSIQPVGDDACLDDASIIHARISWHNVIDHDSDWIEVDIILPIIRRGVFRYSGIDEELLLGVSGLLEYGQANGSVPACWLDIVTESYARKDHNDDLKIRIEMLLGELGIQVEDETYYDYPSPINGEPSDLPIEVLEFLYDIGSTSYEPLDFYYRTLSELPLLTKEEEDSFGRLWQEKHDQRGINGLVEGNLRFVVKEARKFRGLGLDLPDLISEGNLGLIAAAMRFDPMRENRFLTYAGWWVRQSIFRALKEHGQSIRLPDKVSNLVRQLARETQALNQRYGRVATRLEIAASMSIDVITVERLQQLQLMLAVFPINEHLVDLGITDVIDGIGCELETDETAFNIVEEEAFFGELNASLCTLSEKERSIISLRFGFGDDEPMTLDQIGKLFTPSCSRERIRQLEERALSRILERRRRFLSCFLRRPSPVLRLSRPSIHDFGPTEWEWDYGSE